jgi:hypothetical protein
MTRPAEEPVFTIGTASRLTGIPVDTLRAWERRYCAVAPRRCPDSNRRGYTRSDLARLRLIKQLVDQGHAVGTVVHLPEAALKEQMRALAGLQAEAPEPAPAAESRARVLVFGDGLPYQVASWRRELPSLDIVGAHSAHADFERVALDARPEVLLAELPALQPSAVERVRDLAHRAAARKVVLVYAYASSALLEQLRRQGIAALRAPATAAALDKACRLDSAPRPEPEPGQPGADEEAPPRRYDGEALAAIAAAPTRLRCECPRHLTDLLFRLGAYESYSAACENLDAEDAALHAHLRRATGQARALLEDALACLLRKEGKKGASHCCR